ncbi:hypothetical protein MLD38_027845 [Melastoma candidum]|uniref:Uncharacterized protein n=1 Tax=Melastoma candidum TaxID=119954 RepID=A0ACB9P472_9MYRT|nr:hypothetical protein MLD38_027845 [Melastoma candidum]
MSKLRACADPSNLHFKKELTQIRKAVRVLRDPGMTAASSRSPLGTSRSVVVSQRRVDSPLDGVLPQQIEGDNYGKQSKVFLHNWKAKRSSILPFPNSNSGSNNNNSEEVEDHESSEPESSSESLSDARNGVYSKNDEYSVDTRSGSSGLPRRDATLILSGTTAPSVIKRTGKKVNGHVHLLSRRSTKKNSVLYRNYRPPVALSRNGSAELSDDSDEYCRSDDLRQSSGASPLLVRKKKYKNRLDSSKLLREAAKEDSSYTYSTPALSTSSCCWYKNRGSSILGSWDGNATSLNDEENHGDDTLDFPGGHGCGIPCYWSKRTPRHRSVYGSVYSPSFSDTLRKKGSSMFCGSHSVQNGRHHRSSHVSNKRRKSAKNARDVPLPVSNNDGKGGSSVGTGYSDDEVYTNYGELELEALSRLDGRRWSNCRSQDGSEYAALTLGQEEDALAENIRSLSQKYKPMFFDEIIGQKIVVHSLVNAMQRRRIAPVYLFQGPRGTGKTSLARIFAAALNCLTMRDAKPCGICKRCTDFLSGKTKDVWEVDGTSRTGIYDVRCLLKDLSLQPPASSVSSSYKVFIIDECHLLPSKTWLAFLKFVEEPPRGVVFIFITTDLDNVPRSIQSRCQKYIFSKIKDSDISARLRKISALENLDVESDAFDLIALNADGSLRDAETMLDQLSLLGKRITTAIVNELVGIVSDEKLLDLLELALSSDTAETVKRARELLDSGVDPMVLISQLAGLIMDIIAGTYKTTSPRHSESSSTEQTLHEGELEKLKHALKLLSEAKKQLRVSSEQSTWFTATLLQLGSVPSPDISQTGSSQRRSSRATEEDPFLLDEIKEDSCQKSSLQMLDNMLNSRSIVSHSDVITGGARDNFLVGIVGSTQANFTSLEKLNLIWGQCIERCHSKTLRLLLHSHGKLLSISEAEGVLLAYVAFVDKDVKLRIERFLSSITNSMEIILRRNVEVRLILLPGGKELQDLNNLHNLSGLTQKGKATAFEKDNKTPIEDHVEDVLQQKSKKVISRSISDVEGKLKTGTLESSTGRTGASGNLQAIQQSSQLIVEETDENEGTQDVPMQRIESIIREQMLETAWLQAAEKGSPGTLSRRKLEKTLILHEDAIHLEDQVEKASDSQNWEDELNQELKGLKVTDGKALQNETITSCYPMSPSLLHGTTFRGNLNKDSLNYESAGSGNEGCGSMFCWNNVGSHRRRKAKRPGIGSRRRGGLSMFGGCMKSRSVNRLTQIKE